VCKEKFNEENFNVGDWIIITNCKNPTAMKIIEVTNDFYKTSCHPNILGIARDGNNAIRKATQEEIDAVIKIDLNKIFKTQNLCQ
jgi:hypothetical protein